MVRRRMEGWERSRKLMPLNKNGRVLDGGSLKHDSADSRLLRYLCGYLSVCISLDG
jgi:hypothetical protein